MKRRRSKTVEKHAFKDSWQDYAPGEAPKREHRLLIGIMPNNDPTRDRSQKWTLAAFEPDLHFLETARDLFDAKVKAIRYVREMGGNENNISIDGVPMKKYIARGPGHRLGHRYGL
jgi:hypothetical protein